jgi:hypothetical protein
MRYVIPVELCDLCGQLVQNGAHGGRRPLNFARGRRGSVLQRFHEIAGGLVSSFQLGIQHPRVRLPALASP